MIRRPVPLALAAFVLLCLGAGSRAAQQLDPVEGDARQFQVVELTRGLDHPWALAFLPDGDMLVTERSGALRLIRRDGRLERQPITGLPRIVASGQGGLLDVALHPQYGDNGWLYLSYVAPVEGGMATRVARARLDGFRLKDLQEIFSMNRGSTAARHFGSRLLFDRAGYLYVSVGDRGDRPRAQRLHDHAGSVMRLHDDGRIPISNPFVGDPNAAAEIFSYGHRNPQGMALDPVTGMVWIHEHGPQGGDELNRLQAGKNYGWPVITYGVNYGIGTAIGEGTHKAGMVQPVYYWVPSIAPSGMAFYSGDRFPQWQGSLMLGSLKFGLLVRLEMTRGEVIGEERYLHGDFGRIRDVRVGPDGLLYLLTDASDGRLLRLEPPRS